jgi:hypothetical protein
MYVLQQHYAVLYVNSSEWASTPTGRLLKKYTIYTSSCYISGKCYIFHARFNDDIHLDTKSEFMVDRLHFNY